MKKIRNRQGITLIALVVTLIILLILVAVSMTMLLGENGLITKAQQSSETFQIEQGREQINLAVLGMQTEKLSKGESCTLEYIAENIEDRLEGCQVVGTQGAPIKKVFTKYTGYQYTIDELGEVIYIGEVDFNEIPLISIVSDKIVSGVESVTLDITTEVEIGQVEKIITPTGEVQGNSTTYAVTENGDYTFKAITDKGVETQKTVNISNIQEEGVDLTGLVTGSESIEHNCIWERKYDENNHWEECSICGKIQNQEAHNKIYVGGEYTCKSTEPDRYETCSDDCGYSQLIPKPAHISDGKWYKYDTYHYRICKNCKVYMPGEEQCTFQLQDGTVVKKGDSRIHEAGDGAKCLVCGNTSNIKQHMITNDSQGQCVWCLKESTITREYGMTPNLGITGDNWSNIIKTDMTNGNNIDIYYKASCSLGEIQYSSIADYSGGYLQLGTPQVYQKLNNGEIIYKVTVSMNNDTQMINKTSYRALARIFYYHPENAFQDSIGTPAGTNAIYVYIGIQDNNAPEITEITPVYGNLQDGWATNASLQIKGTAKQKELVYLSIYDEENNVILDNVSVATIGTEGEYSYEAQVPIEAYQSKKFTISVKDLIGNESTKQVTLENIDTKAPTYIGETNYTKDWTKVKDITFTAEDRGIGEVEIAFNNKVDYAIAEKVDNQYIRKYRFIGDIYEDVDSIIYMKDKLGNEDLVKLKIGKIDNTSPTITNVKQEKQTGGSTKIIITANDINTTINQEGSRNSRICNNTR